MKDRIFLFVPQMGYGGQERFVSRLSSIISRDFQVYIVLLDNRIINFPLSGTILNINSPVLPTNLGKKICEEIKRCRRFLKYLWIYKPKACISFGEAANLINLICKKHGTAVYTSIRGYVSAEHIRSSKIRQLLYRRSNRIICVSQGIKSFLEKIPCLSGKLSVLYNAYNCEEIYKYSQEPIEKQIGIANPKLVSVGTLRKEKGYWHLLKAVAKLKDKYPTIQLSIVGEDNPPNLNKLQQLVNELGLSVNVTFEGWNENPYKFISQADLYILSSVREGFPNALVEGMACKRAVIANDCLTGPKEILCKDFDSCTIEGIQFVDYGVLVERMDECEDYSTQITEDDNHLAQAIDYLLSNAELRESYENKAFQRAMEFSYEACRKNFLELLH